jgi:hypothetical protein
MGVPAMLWLVVAGAAGAPRIRAALAGTIRTERPYQLARPFRAFTRPLTWADRISAYVRGLLLSLY